MHVEAIGAEVENWIADELPRPVKRDVASAAGLDELDTLALELLWRCEYMRPIVARSHAERNDRRMLEQQQLVGNASRPCASSTSRFWRSSASALLIVPSRRTSSGRSATGV